MKSAATEVGESTAFTGLAPVTAADRVF